MKTSDKNIKQRADQLKSVFFTVLITAFFFLFIHYFSLEIEVPRKENAKLTNVSSEKTEDEMISQDAGTPIDSILKQDIYIPEEVSSPTPTDETVTAPVVKTEQKLSAEQPKKHHKKKVVKEEKPTVAKSSVEKKSESQKSTKKSQEPKTTTTKSSKKTDAKIETKESKTITSSSSKTTKDTKSTASKPTITTETKKSTKDAKPKEKSNDKTTKKSNKPKEKVE